MKIMKQLMILFLVCLISYGISLVLPFTFPASIISMLLMLLLMLLRIIRPESIRETAELLLANMAFFFIPSGVQIFAYYHVIRGDVLQLLLVCLLSLVITFAVTAFTVLGVIRMMGKSE